MHGTKHEILENLNYKSIIKFNINILIDFMIKMYLRYLYIFLTKYIIHNYFK